MAFVLKDRVRESTTTLGTGAFALGGAAGGYRTFASVMANGDTTWYACILPGGAWEVGVGTWVTGNTLQRTTLLDSSTGSAISFVAGTKDIFIALPAAKGNVQNNTFPTGTLMLFQQTNAPIYWTKQVTHNDKALRVVSGAASSGGITPFNSIFNNTIAVQNTTLSIATMPAHTHNAVQPTQSRNDGTSTQSLFAFATSQATSSTGGDGAHGHNLLMQLQYVDLIICAKD